MNPTPPSLSTPLRPEGRAPVCRARPARPQAWCRTPQQRRKRGAVPLVLAAVADQLEAATLADADAPMRSAQCYRNNRLTGRDYPGALALGLPIDSGRSASGHRHVRQARLKPAGTARPPGTPTSSPTGPSSAPMTNGSPAGISRTHF